MFYQQNRKRAQIVNNEPTQTDQAAARETDINVIVGRMVKTGTVPGNPAQPMSGDFTQFPRDLREMIELARSIDEHRNKLPKELQSIALEELLALTPEQISNKLTPAPTPEPKKEETK